MPNLLAWSVGNRNPSISETITVGGVAYNLSTATVKFKAREANSAVLLVDAAAVIVSAPAGTVRYDWTAADASSGILSAARKVLVWWEVTESDGKKQDMGEAFIEILAHAPTSRVYVELEDLKKTISLDGLQNYDLDVGDVLDAASRKVDEFCGRRFYLDVDANQVRYYSPDDPYTLRVDDISVITTLKSDDAGDGTFENTWTLNTDYVREPLNAASDLEPWSKLCVHPSGAHFFPTGFPRSVELTGQFGWPAVPSPVRMATKMVAHRFLKRLREAPHGVVGFGMDGAVVRMMSIDPDVEDLLTPYSRKVLVA
jgi:hypothetical protein